MTGGAVTLVELRCGRRGCGRLLGGVVEPVDWSATLTVPTCPAGHHRGPTPWTARGRWRGWQGVRRRGDAFLIGIALRLTVEDLRPAIERARASGRREVVGLTAHGQA